MTLKPIKLFTFIAANILATLLVFAQKKVKMLEVPAGDNYCKIDNKGKSIIPSGRIVTPAGKTISITKGAFGLSISPDNSRAVVLHNGVVTIVPLNEPEKSVRIPSYDGKIPSVLNNSSFIGTAFSKDSKSIYLSGGDLGNVVVMDAISFKKIKEISLNSTFEGEKYEDSFTSDLIIDQERNELLVLDRANNRLVKIDLQNDKIISCIPVGRIPFGITYNKENDFALVANVGLFDYPLVPGANKDNKDSMNLDFPAYATHSKEMEDGITWKDGRKIPGLGSSLSDDGMSVFLIDMKKNTVSSKIKTGRQIGEFIEDKEIVGGASPNTIVSHQNFAYVSNATNDLISVIDLKKQKIIAEIPIKLDKRVDHLRGILPFGLSLTKDGKTLYVACLGLNAVAVIDTKSKKVTGFIPSGWGATRVQLFDNDRKMAILSARGYGAGPNGGQDFKSPPQGTYIGDIQLSTFQIVNTPDQNALQQYSRQVLENMFNETEYVTNPSNVLPLTTHSEESPIRHIIYITKENRTFDEVLGQLDGVQGDKSLSRLGENVAIATRTDTIRNVNISVNHLKLAREFSVSDNFYCDSDASIHGHHWMVGSIPNEYVEVNSSTSARFLPFSRAKGRRFPKTTGGIDPEDYNEVGGLWENLQRSGVSYYNFGECNEFANASEEKQDTIFGSTNNVVFPFPAALFSNTSKQYAGFNMNIPDQYRAIQFEKEFTEKWLSGKDTMPQFIGIQLPNDHGAGIRPEDGFPYAESFMADNDLALGRIIHFVSRTKYWKNTLIIVTEDDPQGGVDHIDAHRSILLMTSPYVKRGHISHKHANFGSILKVIYHILQVPYVNQYDATASFLNDFFTDKPDLRPFTVENCDARIFDPQFSLKYYNKNFDWKKILQGPEMDNEDEQRTNHYKNKQ
ncbi:MAG: bifunctional YncE family protein/alkaline phosphatase family protein [Saprospiraceae bacterium]